MTTYKEYESQIQEHLSPLYRTAFRMSRNKEDAEDLVQETIIKGFKYFDKFEKGTNFKAWIFKILTNTYINQYRKKVKTPPMTDFASIEPIYEDIVKENTQFTLDEIDKLREKLSDEISLALDKLAPEYRLVFLLSTVEDFTYQEISHLIDCPIGTVMSRLYRARKALRDDLWEYAQKNRIIKEKEGRHEMS